MISLYDPIRKKNVADTPEERVRQYLIQQMLGPLAFPRSLVAVEKKLSRASRRADIIAYMKREDKLAPLVLVECKAAHISEEDYWQAAGYNDTLLAPFICLAHAGGIRTFWREAKQTHSVGFLPPYEQLLRTIVCSSPSKTSSL